jgi:hypothetical protein
MPVQRVNKFTSWEFTPIELKVAASFNDLQIKLMQSEIARAAEEKILLTYDPANPLAFVQREAELQGNINALEYLLSLSQSQSESDSQSEGE